MTQVLLCALICRMTPYNTYVVVAAVVVVVVGGGGGGGRRRRLFIKG